MELNKLDHIINPLIVHSTESNPTQQLVDHKIAHAYADLTNAALSERAIDPAIAKNSPIEYLKIKITDKLAKELKPPTHLFKKQDGLAFIQKLKTKSESEPISSELIALDFYKICGCRLSYGGWVIGETIPSPGGDFGSFTISKIIKNENGLQVLVLMPNQKGGKPIVCCRGTDEKNLHNIIDDLGHSGTTKGIGQYSYEISKNEIRQTIRDLTLEFGSIVLTGHSLGGALCQLIATDCMTLTVLNNQQQLVSAIEAVYLFNSPGIGNVIAKKYGHLRNDLIQIGISPPITTSVWHINDLVYHCGGKHIHEDICIDISTPVIGVRQAHSNAGLISEIALHHLKIQNEARSEVDFRARLRKFFIANLVEQMRTSFIGNLATQILKDKLVKQSIYAERGV